MKPACLPEQLLCRAVGVLPRARQCARFVLAERPMRAAFERAFIVSRFGEHRARGRDMVLASRVRRAAERNLLVAETQAVRGAACDKRQSLERLDGGARINRPIGVAKGHHHPAIRIDDRAGPAMGGFDERAAHSLDDHGIGHGLLLPGQRFKVTQAMNAPVPSAPIAMRPNSGTSNGCRTILPPRLCNLCNQSINVVDFKIAQPVRRIGVGHDSAHVEDAGDWLVSSLGDPVGAILHAASACLRTSSQRSQRRTLWRPQHRACRVHANRNFRGAQLPPCCCSLPAKPRVSRPPYSSSPRWKRSILSRQPFSLPPFAYQGTTSTQGQRHEGPRDSLVCCLSAVSQKHTYWLVRLSSR